MDRDLVTEFQLLYDCDDTPRATVHVRNLVGLTDPKWLEAVIIGSFSGKTSLRLPQ
jgi:hypothetical protein